MRRHLLTFTLLIAALPFMLLASSIVSNFIAIPDNDRVYVRWISQNESGLIRYELYGQRDNNPPTLLTTLTPLGNNRTYEFVDLSVGGLNRNANPNEPPMPMLFQRLTYTLKMITASGTLEVQTQVNFQTSTTRRTWGSIKALFR